MKNIEFYKDELGDCSYVSDAYDFAHKHGMNEESARSIWGDIFEWLISEHQILDDAEKKYLKNVIRPFKEKVENIAKEQEGGYEFIEIFYREGCNCNCISFPNFDIGTMYKGMKTDELYGLEELGL